MPDIFQAFLVLICATIHLVRNLGIGVLRILLKLVREVLSSRGVSLTQEKDTPYI